MIFSIQNIMNASKYDKKPIIYHFLPKNDEIWLQRDNVIRLTCHTTYENSSSTTVESPLSDDGGFELVSESVDLGRCQQGKKWAPEVGGSRKGGKRKEEDQIEICNSKPYEEEKEEEEEDGEEEQEE